MSKTPVKYNTFRNLVADLVRVVGAPDLLTPSVELTHRKAELALCEVKNILESMPAVPDTTADVFYPMDMFYHAEATIFKQVRWNCSVL